MMAARHLSSDLESATLDEVLARVLHRGIVSTPTSAPT
jgi:hypothetical protein